MSLTTENVHEGLSDHAMIELEEIDMSPVLIFPEQRMWAAVAVQLIEDYETALKRVHAVWFGSNVKCSYQLLLELRSLRREAVSLWFQSICEHINVHHDHVNGKLDRLDTEYRLKEVQFTLFADMDSHARKDLHTAG